VTQAYVDDSGVLTAAANNERRVWARHKLALAEGCDVHVPAIVVGQAWRDDRRQVLLGKFLAGCSVDPVGPETAKAAGILCGRARTADVVDATVAVMGAARSAVIWTSDPDELQRLVDHTGARPGPVVRAVPA
jgi:hypothetical protein